jgi:hypothetical protein
MVIPVLQHLASSTRNLGARLPNPLLQENGIQFGPAEVSQASHPDLIGSDPGCSMLSVQSSYSWHRFVALMIGNRSQAGQELFSGENSRCVTGSHTQTSH